MSTSRVRHVENLLRPPPRDGEKDKTSDYERSMRIGLKEDDLRMFLLMLYICRATRELIEKNLPLIYDHICMYIEYSLQNLAWNILPVCLVKNNSNKPAAPAMSTLDSVRTLVGNFQDGDQRIDPNVKKFGKQDIKECPTAPPHEDLAEMARILIEMVLNKGKGVVKGKKPLKS